MGLGGIVLKDVMVTMTMVMMMMMMRRRRRRRRRRKGRGGNQSINHQSINQFINVMTQD